MVDIDPLSLDFAVRHPDSFARVLGRAGVAESSQIVESLPPQRKAAIVARLPAARIIEMLDSGKHDPARWLVDAPFDDAVNLLSRIPRERRLALVNGLPDRLRQRRLLRHQQYPAHSVGALVSDIRVRLSAESPAADVLAELRELETEDPGPIVIVDADGRYVGGLDRWRLLMQNPPAGVVKDYLVPIRALHPETPVAAVLTDVQWHARNWLPVIDHRRRVLGAVMRAAVFRATGPGAHASRFGSDILVELLADLVYVCEAALHRGLQGKDAR